jgi:hypothetical protein
MSEDAKNASLKEFRSRLTVLPSLEGSQAQDTLETLRLVHPHTVCWVDPLSLGPRLHEFNCYALAFRLVFVPEFFERRSGVIKAVVDMPLVFEMLKRTQQIDASEVRRLDLVVYSDQGKVCHAGVVVEQQAALTVRSKWGNGSIFDHTLLEVPLEYGWSVRYFAALPAKSAWELFIQHHERAINAFNEAKRQLLDDEL